MSRLEELAKQFGTDKYSHGYLDFYEQHLPKNPKRMLEIGVLDGASMRMWREYFPETELHGLDLFQYNPVPNKIWNINWHIGDQCDPLVHDKLRKLDFDVIIDDGSHNSRDQMITFFGLFNGKQYYIEDLHCNDQEFYSQGLPYYATAKGIFQTLDFFSGLVTNFSKNKNIVLIEKFETPVLQPPY